MKTIYKLTSAIVVAVVLTAGTFYLWTSKSLSERQEEIDSLQEKIGSLQEKTTDLQGKIAERQEEIDSLKEKRGSLQERITDLQGKMAESQSELADKEATISSLEGKIENTKKFWRSLLRGIEEYLSEALTNKGAGWSDFNDFKFFYEEERYEDAKYFADRVDVYFGYAADDLVKTKGCFLAAKKYAPSERSIRLVENSIKLCEYGIDMFSEMHEAGEYYSSACNYYAKEQWSQGNEALEKANRHVDAHDNLVDPYSEYLSNIISLLE